MEEQRKESESVGDCRVPLEETGKGLGLASKTKTLDGEVDVPQKEPCIEDANTVEVSDSGVCDVSGTDENPTDGGSVSDEKQVRVDVGSVTKDIVEKTVSSDDVEKTDAFTEPETERNHLECNGDAGAVEVKPVNGESHKSAGEEESVISGGNEVTDEKTNCEVEDIGGDDSDATTSDAEQNVQTEKSQQRSVDGETPSVAEDKADQKKESANKSDEDNPKMDVYSKQVNEENVGLNEQGNQGSETKDDNHSESAQVPEETTQFSKGEANEGNPATVSEVKSAGEISREEETTNVNQTEENGEAMEIDYTAEEPVEKNVLDNAGNESAGASIVPTQDVPIDEADGNDSYVVKEMEVDELNENVDMASDLSGTIQSADCSANPKCPSEDAATGEVEPLDHNALFDPSSDITNFIDFSGVSCWSGNIQDLKTETNISLKEDKKAIDLAEEVASVDGKETLKSVDETVNAESHDNISLIAEEHQEEKDHECLDKKPVDQQDAMREEDDSAHETPSIEPNQKEDTEMEENPNNSDYADDGTNSDTKTNGVKRKADALSEDSLGEGRKTVSLAKVSFAQRPSFKIGACIARAATQMAGSPSVLKGSNFGDETLSVESFVSQLHCAATDPDKENVVSEIAAGFFLDFRNSSAPQQFTPEKVISKRGRPSNSTVGGTEAFEFEEMGDTYWTDRVSHYNGGEEQTPPTEKENYQVVPVELKPAQVKKTRRPYRRRQSQISILLPSASDKPANIDENAPAELIMNFSETDTIPPEKSLSKMFRRFGPIRESQTEVDKENNRARVVYRKSADAEVAYNSAGRFNIFGTKAVNYELSFTITETFKVHPYVVSLGEEEAAHCVPSET